MSFEAKLDSPPSLEASAAARMRDALSLFEDGIAMQRLTLKRQHPTADPDEVTRLLYAWLARSDEDR